MRSIANRRHDHIAGDVAHVAVDRRLTALVIPLGAAAVVESGRHANVFDATGVTEGLGHEHGVGHVGGQRRARALGAEWGPIIIANRVRALIRHRFAARQVIFAAPA